MSAPRSAALLPLLLLTACFDQPARTIRAVVANAMMQGNDVTVALSDQQLEEAMVGNSVFGGASPAVRAGKVSASLSATRVTRLIPQSSGVAIATTQFAERQPLTVAEVSANRVKLDLAVSAYGGLNVDGTKILSFELLGSAAMTGAQPGGGFNVARSGKFAFGLGQRLGVIQEGAKFPGISLSSTWNPLPSLSWETTTVPTTSGERTNLSMGGYSGSIVSHRLAAEKGFGKLAVTAGWGRDKLSAKYTQYAYVSGVEGGSGEQSGYRATERSLLFLGASYNFSPTLGIAAELVRGGKVPAPPVNDVGGGGAGANTRLRVGMRLR